MRFNVQKIIVMKGIIAMERKPRFPGVDWYCDHCGDYLNNQAGFDDHKYIWKCTNCGGKNSISRDNIRKTNFQAFNSLFKLFDVLRTISMNLLLMTITMLAMGNEISNLPRYLVILSRIYPVLLIITFIVIAYGHYHRVGIISTLLDMIVSDIIRPFRELFRTGSIIHDIRFHVNKLVVVWNIICLIVFMGIVTVDILFINHICVSQWGSVSIAIENASLWIGSISNLRELYIPFLISVSVMVVITFLAFGLDKYYAKKAKWRTKESTLFLFSIMFGSVGAVIGMKVFRHKINKPGFKVIIPILAVLQIALIAWFSVRFFA